MISFTPAGQMKAYINSSTVPMTQPKAKGNVFSFDYVIKEMVNVAAVQHGVWPAKGKLGGWEVF